MGKIVFKAEKELGTILQDTAQFIKENIVEMSKVILPIVAVPLVIGAGFFSYFYYNLSNTIVDMSQSTEPGLSQFSAMMETFYSILPGYLLVGIAMMLFYIGNISYIKQYVKGEEKISVGSIMSDIKSKSLLLFFGGLLTIIIVYAGMFLCVLPGIYLGVILALQFIIAIIEDKGYGESFGRSFSLMKNKWWASFGLYFVTTLIIMAISFIVILPFYIYMGASMMTSVNSGSPENAMSSLWVLALMVPVMFIVQLLCMAIMNTVAAMNYFSLAESKDGNAEFDAINNIGK